MLELRYYQRDALDALYKYWEEGGGNGLIVLPTGAGKALVIAKLIEELLADYPTLRILNVTHDARLVEQNFKEFIGLMPFAPAGIYSAGLNRRDARAQILFCGIQSVWNKIDILGDIDLVIVDEAHAISRNSNTQYGKFFVAVRERNPDSRTCGTTATDYRMDSGRLTDDLDTDGEEVEGVKKFKLFDDVVYEIGIGELIEQGYLTRLTSQKTASKIDLKGIGTRGGEYIPGQVSEAAEAIIEEAVAEDMILSEGRRAGLFFSTSKENANHVAEAIRRHGRPCAVLTSDNAHQTKEIFEGFRAGRYWAISSVSMITTGTNFPFVDFISLILSTKSPGKLVQILGRGTRNCEGKTDCLIADHGRNLAYHGPIDQIRPREPGKGLGEQPKKLCPQDQVDVNGNCGCGEMLPISIMTCQCCGYVFPPSEEEKITAQADTTPVLSSEKPWSEVTSRTFRHHPGKEGKPDSVKCTYMIGMKAVNEWLCCEHKGYPKAKADRFWMAHGGQRPFPSTVIEWLERSGELNGTAEVQLDYAKNAKYPDVMAHRSSLIPDNDNVPEAANDNRRGGYAEDWEMADDIPF
ncbi:DEAD/DEAH box helicase family protein [Rhizobium sp. 16-449-1b]|uniref:DEAD/DEAH box helicase n=1 Tax=Rhizobium sp. 16-449-1b TaxID=2819989 RepID=UPI001ADC78B2|nr:DEAD/DEAH box helicase family protein [Rhizobium sp. 16-449-1b]MBO9194356.1 DEAD/DEAH box helicase family protein [Rhizobium sp. 16-449-1b]